MLKQIEIWKRHGGRLEIVTADTDDYMRFEAQVKLGEWKQAAMDWKSAFYGWSFRLIEINQEGQKTEINY